MFHGISDSSSSSFMFMFPESSFRSTIYFNTVQIYRYGDIPFSLAVCISDKIHALLLAPSGLPKNIADFLTLMTGFTLNSVKLLVNGIRPSSHIPFCAEFSQSDGKNRGWRAQARPNSLLYSTPCPLRENSRQSRPRSAAR